jgi:hypothetical protein
MMQIPARILLISLFMGQPAMQATAQQKQSPPPKATPATKPRPLTTEEKEILKHFAILEKLELLQNFEKIQFLNFLADKQPASADSKAPAKPTGKDNASKNPSK